MFNLVYKTLRQNRNQETGIADSQRCTGRDTGRRMTKKQAVRIRI
jgi:hypothetical protein